MMFTHVSARQFLGPTTPQSGRLNFRARRTLCCEPLEDRRMLAVVTVNTPNDVVDFADGLTSLREAVFATNLVGGHDEIVFDFGHDGPETIVLTQGELVISDSLTITGPGSKLLTIDVAGSDPTPMENAGDGSRVFRIVRESSRSYYDVSFTGLKLIGGDVDGSGGAIQSSALLTLNDVSIAENFATISGGGLFIQRQATLEDVTVSNNETGGYGGGVYIASLANVTIRNSMVDRNFAAINGGGLIGSRSASTEIYDSTISANTAINGGGGISLSYGNTFLSGTNIQGNQADVGGGIYSTSNGLVLKDSAFLGNQATNRGGAVMLSDSELEILNGRFSSNSALASGGAVYLEQANLQIEGTLFEANRAHGGSGGAISISSPTGEAQTAQIENCRFLGNSSIGGGGAISAHHVTLDIDQGLFRSNQALDQRGDGGGGGAILSTDASVRILQSVFRNNLSVHSGGALSVAGPLVVESTLLADNRAAVNGGAIYVSSNAATHVLIAGSSLTNNVAMSGSGGGIFTAALDSGVVVTNSTISQNRSAETGAGIYFGGGSRQPSNSTFRLSHSTVASNSVQSGAVGSAVVASYSQFSIDNSIISQNTPGLSQNTTDIAASGTGSFIVDYALIGTITPGTPVTATHLQLGVAPLLLQLDTNGSSIVLPEGNRLLTHALQSGSPAIDSGDPSLMAGTGNTPQFDQRSAPHSRVAIGNGDLTHVPVVDLGAYESRQVADFSGDRLVGGRDFLIWQRFFGNSSRATYSEGDATGNGSVDAGDLAVWRYTYGTVLPAPPRGRLTAAVLPGDEASTVLSLAFAVFGKDEEPPLPLAQSSADSSGVEHPVDARRLPYRPAVSKRSTPPARPSLNDVPLDAPEVSEANSVEWLDVAFADI